MDYNQGFGKMIFVTMSRFLGSLQQQL